MTNAHRVTIDREQCISCGMCWDTCPEVFEQNTDDAFSQIVEKYRAGNLNQGEVPEKFYEKVKNAVDSCLVQIIHVE